eukprot:5492279-Lingulodinium_polyedra.AAC.1
MLVCVPSAAHALLQYWPMSLPSKPLPPPHVAASPSPCPGKAQRITTGVDNLLGHNNHRKYMLVITR